MTRALALLAALLWYMPRADAADGGRFTWTVGKPGPGITVAVDATSLKDVGLVYVREWIDEPDVTALVYPLWVPGTHAPSGPVQNLGGLTLSDASGKAVPWERDARDPWRIQVRSPAPRPLRLDLTYIANHVTTNSAGIDILGSARDGLINWNCLLFYPAQLPCAGLPCSLAIRLPTGWDFASALKVQNSHDDIVQFLPTTLSEAIDAPVLCGVSMLHVILRPDGGQPGVTMHVTASQAEDGQISGREFSALRHLPEEADLLFGGSWFDHFDILLLLGASSMGLEHGTSSVNGMRKASLDDVTNLWSRELIPHEFVHSWIGKHRRPQGMLTPTYQETPVFDDLWVYEGLTELLGRVLSARCGFLSAEGWRAGMLRDMLSMQSEPGRNWRSLRDTCRCSWQLRSPSQNHAELRRGQDYYYEGALFWLVVDRRIRTASGGTRSLDDLCQRFFGPHGSQSPGYTEQELVAALNSIVPLDWSGMIARWIDGTGELDTHAILDGCGWRVERVQVDPHDEDQLAAANQGVIRDAIGCEVRRGYIRDLDPQGAAAGAGLQEGDYIYSINGTKLAQPMVFVRNLAMANSVCPALLVVGRKGRWHTYQLLPLPLTIQALVRDPTEADLLSLLIAPRRAVAAVSAGH